MLGLRLSRLGPTCPVAPAALSVWQFTQFCFKIWSPLLALWLPLLPLLLDPPQAATSSAATTATSERRIKRTVSAVDERLRLVPRMRTPRTLLALLRVAPLLLAGLQAVTGGEPLVLYAAPFLLLLGLLLSGRFI